MVPRLSFRIRDMLPDMLLAKMDYKISLQIVLLLKWMLGFFNGLLLPFKQMLGLFNRLLLLFYSQAYKTVNTEKICLECLFCHNQS